MTAIIKQTRLKPDIKSVQKPDEYKALLREARQTVDNDIQIVYETTAKKYVPELYDILIRNEFSPKLAKLIIYEDCNEMWGQRHIRKFLPAAAFNQNLARSKAHIIQKKNGLKRRKQELEKLKPFLPDIEKENDTTQRFAARLVRRLASPPITLDKVSLSVVMEDREYKKIVKAHDKSKSGACMIYISNGQIVNVEPIDN